MLINDFFQNKNIEEKLISKHLLMKIKHNLKRIKKYNLIKILEHQNII